MGARDVTGFQTCALPLSVIDASVVNAPLDSDNLLVGFWLGGGSYFVGAMDELRVYNRVLSARSEERRVGKGGICRCYAFDEDKSSLDSDSSGNGNAESLW